MSSEPYFVETGPRVPLSARVSVEAVRARLTRMLERGVLIGLNTPEGQLRREQMLASLALEQEQVTVAGDAND